MCTWYVCVVSEGYVYGCTVYVYMVRMSSVMCVYVYMVCHMCDCVQYVYMVCDVFDMCVWCVMYV